MQKNISCAALPPLRPPGGRRYACISCIKYFYYRIINQYREPASPPEHEDAKAKLYARRARGKT